LQLLEAEMNIAKDINEAQSRLDANVLAHYGKLTETEIKMLVVDDKWLTSITAATEAEVSSLTEGLVSRVKELEDRYSVTLLNAEQVVNELSRRTEAHFLEMGLTLE